MVQKYKSIALLFIIFLIALLLRSIDLSTIPFSMHADEVVNTFVGRYILIHGTDPNGNFLPLFYFDKFGDYPPVLPMYLSGIATFLFGVNAFASRIPSAFFGALLIFPVFFLAKRFFNEKVAFISVSILAIFPWHIVLSRASSEGIIGLTCFAFALQLFLKGVIEEKYLLTAISLVLSALTYLLYPSFRIIIPLVFLPLPFFFPEKKKRIFTLCVALALLGLTLLISSTTWGKGRFTQTSVFTSKDVTTGIAVTNQIFSNNEGKNNVLVARIFHNKLTGYYWVLTTNYLSYFSPAYLFFQDGHPDRYVVPQEGLLLIIFLVFFATLFLFPKKEIYKTPFYYVFYLLVITPIPAALTVDDTPNIHRSVAMIIPLTLLISLGIVALFDSIKKQSFLVKKTITTAVILLISLQFIYFWHQYTVSQTSYKSILRNDGNRELVMYLQANKNIYQNIIVPSDYSLAAYYLFYTNNFQERKFGKFITLDNIDNIEFQGFDCPSSHNIAMKNILTVDKASCKTDPDYKTIYSIKRKDGTEAFKILVAKKI